MEAPHPALHLGGVGYVPPNQSAEQLDIGLARRVSGYEGVGRQITFSLIKGLDNGRNLIFVVFLPVGETSSVHTNAQVRGDTLVQFRFRRHLFERN